MLVRKVMRCSELVDAVVRYPSRASRRWTMVFMVTGWDPTRHRTPSNGSGNWVMAANKKPSGAPAP